MRISYEEWETKVQSLVNNIFGHYIQKFSDVDLKIGETEIVIIDKEESTYESELRTFIFKDKNIFDAIEFFIFKNGDKQFTLEELEIWLNDTLNDILNRKH